MNVHLVLRSALIPSLAAGCLLAQNGTPPPPTQVPVAALSLSDPNLEVTVWAQSPQIRNPTNMDFDQDGRVWVAEGINYRGHYNRQPLGDRIVILEDTDGDGRSDRDSVFVQEPGLRAPMGIAVIDNRVVVSMAPDIIIYTDVNRDRKFDPAVDTKEVLLTGFNGRKHDHTVHSVTLGPDGQWYWNAGNCGALFTDKSGRTFRIGSAYDPTYGGGKADLGWEPTKIAGSKSDDGHVWIGGFAARMNPDGSGVRIIGHNFRNSYEQTVTSFGDVFQNDNDDPPACRTAFLLESGNAGFCSFDGQRSWGADKRPGQSVPTAEWRQEDPGTMPSGDVYGGGSPTGIAFAEDSLLGSKYRGLLLSCEPGRNVVFGYLPKPQGAGFELKRFEFLTSNREGEFAGTDFKGGGNDKDKRDLKTMFRPSDVGIGADGAIYVADWFDARVGGHADWDETQSGTIYRIAPKGSKVKVPKVDLTTLDGAIAALKSPAVNVRGAGYEALKGRGTEAVKPLTALLKDSNPYVRARAVWLLSLNPGPGLDRVAKGLGDSDASMRVVTFRALRRAVEQGRVTNVSAPEKVPGTREYFLGVARRLATDPSPAVRREVALAMRDEPMDVSGDILLTLARGFDGQDRTYLEAWGTGAWGKEETLYAALRAGMGAGDPVQWSPAMAWLAWRLHPAQSVADFQARALAAPLGDSSRKRALTAIGYNPTAQAAEAMLEVASKADGLVKAEALWWLLNRKDSSWKDAGLDSALKSRGVYDPDTVALIEATIPEAEAPKFTVAEAASLSGSAKRGAEKFGATCASCHRAGDAGTEYAPNLTGWAKRQTTDVLLNSVINPSAEIASGFNGTELKTKDGLVIQGLLLSEGDPLIVQSASGLTQMVPKGRVESRKGLNRSLMMSADQLGLSAQDLADINAFLKTQ
jgi:putative membrane-bound dehydrogenase-like protein